MDASDSVTVVALLVSLVALLVTAGQLLTQLFSTADGYRRCSNAFIGIWHKERKRRFLLTEFRFETTYVAPQIVLLSPEDLQKAKKYSRGAYPLHCFRPEDDGYKLLSQTVHPEWSGRKHTRKSVLLPKRPHASDAERAVLDMPKITDQKSMIWRDDHRELRVTWLLLLEELHSLYASYWPSDCDVCDHDWWPEDSSMSTDKYEQSEKDRKISPFRTDVGVIYRRWNWDFMPAEITRPLAQTNLGDIVVLALRMGMRWQNLEPQNGRMQADGNGYNLSSTEVRSVGIILKLSVSGTQKNFPRITPSKAADKFMCGIVPGCPELVQQDFKLVDDDGKGISLASGDGIFFKIGLSHEKRRKIGSHNHNGTRTDTIILLSNFLVPKGSLIMQHLFPEWHFNIYSVFHYWEGRVVLFRHLQHQIMLEKRSPPSQILSSVWEFFQTLDFKYSTDFWACWDRPTCTFNNLGPEKKSSMLELCRAAFDYTTEALKSHAGQFGKPDNLRRPRYLHLVAAHANMSTHAITQARSKIREKQDAGHDLSQGALRKEHDVSTDNFGPYFSYEMFEEATAYLENMSHPQHGIAAYLEENSVVVSKAEAEEAWWLIMLRGTAWSMATWDAGMGDRRVPSSFYENKMPIWIT